MTPKNLNRLLKQFNFYLATVNQELTAEIQKTTTAFEQMEDKLINVREKLKCLKTKS